MVGWLGITAFGVARITVAYAATVPVVTSDHDPRSPPPPAAVDPAGRVHGGPQFAASARLELNAEPWAGGHGQGREGRGVAK